MASGGKQAGTAEAASVANETPQEAYAKLSWARRGSVASALLVTALLIWLVGWFLPGLTFIATNVVFVAMTGVVSVCLLSGPVYYPPKPDDKALREWSVANKIFAVVFVFGGLLSLIRALLE